MDQTFACALQQAPIQDHLAHGFVGGKHGENRVRVEGQAGRFCHLGALALQGFGGSRRSVPDPHAMASLDQASGHARAHIAQADEADIHGRPSCHAIRLTILSHVRQPS
jgi:hypothetical protein